MHCTAVSQDCKSILSTSSRSSQWLKLQVVFLLILHIGTTKGKVSHYQECKSICTWRWISELPTSETLLVEVNNKPVFTITSCELAGWESPNCGCTAIAIHRYNADISTFILFCSECLGIRFYFLDALASLDFKLWVSQSVTFFSNSKVQSTSWGLMYAKDMKRVVSKIPNA